MFMAFTSLVGTTTMQYGPSARRTLGVRELSRSTTGMAYDNVFPVKKHNSATIKVGEQIKRSTNIIRKHNLQQGINNYANNCK